MSEYLEKMRRDEERIFDDHQRKIQLGKIFDQYKGNVDEIKKNYSLQKKDEDILEEIRAEADLQKLHDQAFLSGFLNGGKH